MGQSRERSECSVELIRKPDQKDHGGFNFEVQYASLFALAH
jgi:hypothetical protein